MNARLLMSGIAASLVLCGTTACSSDPLSVSCKDYLGKSDSEQLDLAVRWGAPNHQTSYPGASLVGPAYRQDLLNYCPAHPKDRLKDLEFRFGLH